MVLRRHPHGRLVGRLADGTPQSISSLTDGSNLTRQVITKHLRALEDAAIVSRSRSGTESQFRFHPEPIEKAKAYLDMVSAQWDDALGRLKSFVEVRG